MVVAGFFGWHYCRSYRRRTKRDTKSRPSFTSGEGVAMGKVYTIHMRDKSGAEASPISNAYLYLVRVSLHLLIATRPEVLVTMAVVAWYKIATPRPLCERRIVKLAVLQVHNCNVDLWQETRHDL